MLFNSVEFLFFLPIVYVLYWFVLNKSLRLQNLLILVASYVFYGWWDWRFLSLIFISTLADYFIGIKIHEAKQPGIRNRWLWASVAINLGILGFFKYYNFFIHSWVDMFASFGYAVSPWTISIILPVGISFYTFQTMSYSLDVYKGQLKPTHDFIDFAAFVSFFPQLVAGPIERASNLLPQVAAPRKFNYQQSVDGIKLAMYGMFKKVVVADALAPLVDDVFSNYTSMPGISLFLGAIFFAFQIYCDFSGYSDIAIGISKIFGFELMSNFRFPYFSRDISEFWRRWHISLSTWFRDYVYIPLGGSRASQSKSIRNIFVIFLVSGFWHGANWTFLAWGFIHALYFVPLFLLGQNRKHKDSVVGQNSILPSLREFFQISLTFALVTLAWIFFRSPTIGDSFSYITQMFDLQNFYAPLWKLPTEGLYYVAAILLLDWMNRKNERSVLQFKSPWIRWAFYIIISVIVIFYFKGELNFIYFQF